MQPIQDAADSMGGRTVRARSRKRDRGLFLLHNHVMYPLAHA